MHSTAHHGIDVHVESRVLSQDLELLVENFEALLRDVVGIDVVDRDLQPFEAGAIQALNAVRH